MGKRSAGLGIRLLRADRCLLRAAESLQKLTGLENLRFFASLYSGETADPMALLDAVGLADDANASWQVFQGNADAADLRAVAVQRSGAAVPRRTDLGPGPVNARKVKDIILGLKARGRTIFLTTHDMATADELCDRVAFVVDGRIEALDTPAELKIARGQRLVRVEYRGENGRLETAEFGMDGLADDGAFHTLLRNHHVETIHSREASLNDVFVEVTGRRLS